MVRKIFIACMLLMSWTANASGPYVCFDWMPTSVCDAQTGETLESHLLSRYAEGYTFLMSGTLVEVGPSHMRRYTDIIFNHPVGGYQLVDTCDQLCNVPLTGTCPIGTEPDPDEHNICKEIVPGPFECPDTFDIGWMCNPDGSLQQHYIDQRLSNGDVFDRMEQHSSILFVGSEHRLWLDWSHFWNTQSGEVATDLCRKICPEVAQCSAGLVPNDINVCDAPPTPDEPPPCPDGTIRGLGGECEPLTPPDGYDPIVFPSASIGYNSDTKAAQAAGDQARAEGDPNLTYSAVIYRTSQGYHYSDLIQGTADSVPLDDFAAMANAIRLEGEAQRLGDFHAQPVTDTSGQLDYELVTEMEALGMRFHYVLTGAGDLVRQY